MSKAAAAGKLLLLISVVLASSCSLTHTPHNQDELQQTALARWNGCIERHRGQQDASTLNRQKMVRARCEGYQRDVLATFPIHLENQVDTLLSQRSNNMTTEHFLRSSKVATWNIRESTQVNTLNQRSSNAQSNDL